MSISFLQFFYFSATNSNVPHAFLFSSSSLHSPLTKDVGSPLTHCSARAVPSPAASIPTLQPQMPKPAHSHQKVLVIQHKTDVTSGLRSNIYFCLSGCSCGSSFPLCEGLEMRLFDGIHHRMPCWDIQERPGTKPNRCILQMSDTSRMRCFPLPCTSSH